MKKSRDDYFNDSLDRCTKCGSHDVKQSEQLMKNGCKVVTVYCHHCKEETRKRLAS